MMVAFSLFLLWQFQLIYCQYESWNFDSADTSTYNYDNYAWTSIFQTSFNNNVQPPELYDLTNAVITNEQLELKVTVTDKPAGVRLDVSPDSSKGILLKFKAYAVHPNSHSNSEVYFQGLQSKHKMFVESYRYSDDGWSGEGYCLNLLSDTFTIWYNDGNGQTKCSADVSMDSRWTGEWFIWTHWLIPYEYESTSVVSWVDCMEREKINDPTSKSSICGIVNRAMNENENIIRFGSNGWWTVHELYIDDIEIFQTTISPPANACDGTECSCQCGTVATVSVCIDANTINHNAVSQNEQMDGYDSSTMNDGTGVTGIEYNNAIQKSQDWMLYEIIGMLVLLILIIIVIFQQYKMNQLWKSQYQITSHKEEQDAHEMTTITT